MILRALFPRLLLGLALAAAPLAFYQPAWLGIAWVLVATFRYWQVRHGKGLLGAWVRVPLALLGLFAVLATYGTVAGRDPGIALLTSMIALKLLEVQRPRDVYLAVFLGYFLIMANFLYSQEMPMIAYLVASVLALTATLVALQRRGASPERGNDVRLAGRLLLQGVPIAIVLFVLFPRIDEPLWRMPTSEDRATTGISGEMSPGSISELALSDEVAFRAEFDSTPPPPELRYWRGPVLWFTNGVRWRVGTPPAADGQRFTPLGEAVSYRVTLEPHRQRWLFALDLPAEISGKARITSDYRALSEDPIEERIRYRGLSYLDYRTDPPNAAELRSALQRPSRSGTRLQALAAAWRATARDDAGVVALALAHFRDEPFVYTLSPPALGDDPMDEFLFETRRGFCEHYAAAFTLLMRAAGIPARVVTGYQGGQYNPLGNYLIVRQSDAHAWAEVWLDDGGWRRVDPTAAIAPERIERAIDPGASASLDGAIRFRGGRVAPLERWLEQARLTIDAIGAYWDRWVLGYGLEQQLALLAALGVSTLPEMALLLALVAGIAMAGVGIMILRRPRPRGDPPARLYARFCRKLARAGIVRHASEGPQAFAARVATARPDLADECARITALYVGLRYARVGGESDALADLQRRINRFRCAPQRGNPGHETTRA